MTPSELWACKDSAAWLEAYNCYGDALSLVSARKGEEKGLRQLDEWMAGEAGTSFAQKKFMTLEELKKVMRWKITRGKFRPLMRLIEQNSSSEVEEVSKESFALLREKKFTDALHKITALKGVGVATASAILGLLAPEEFPFMSDEALELCISGGREYTAKAYEPLRETLKKKAAELGKGWTSERVGRAIWASSILAVPAIDGRKTALTSKRKAVETNPNYDIVEKTDSKKESDTTMSKRRRN